MLLQYICVQRMNTAILITINDSLVSDSEKIAKN